MAYLKHIPEGGPRRALRAASAARAARRVAGGESAARLVRLARRVLRALRLPPAVLLVCAARDAARASRAPLRAICCCSGPSGWRREWRRGRRVRGRAGRLLVRAARRAAAPERNRLTRRSLLPPVARVRSRLT